MAPGLIQEQASHAAIQGPADKANAACANTVATLCLLLLSLRCLSVRVSIATPVNAGETSDREPSAIATVGRSRCVFTSGHAGNDARTDSHAHRFAMTACCIESAYSAKPRVMRSSANPSALRDSRERALSNRHGAKILPIVKWFCRDTLHSRNNYIYDNL